MKLLKIEQSKQNKVLKNLTQTNPLVIGKLKLIMICKNILRIYS